MRLTAEEVALLIEALNRAITHRKSAVKLTKAGKAEYNIIAQRDTLHKMENLRTRLLAAEVND